MTIWVNAYLNKINSTKRVNFNFFYLFICIFISFKMNLNGARFFFLCLLQISPFSSHSLFSRWTPTSSLPSLSPGHMKVFHSNWHYRICCKTTVECMFDFKVILSLSHTVFFDDERKSQENCSTWSGHGKTRKTRKFLWFSKNNNSRTFFSSSI